MPSIKSYPLPPSVPPEARGWVQELFTYWLARFDPRNPESDFAGGLVAEDDGTVTLDEAYPQGRTATVVALTSRIANTGKAQDQRFLRTVSVFNRHSAQNTNPLTSVSDATTATITVGPFTFYWGGGTTSYSGGTISGLDTDETYEIYADDPDLQGGAVALTATTVATDVVSGNDRVYVGRIATAKNASTANLSNATQANPGVITTTAAHGYDTGDQVSFSSVGGMTQLNTGVYTITRINATSFSLNGTDTTAFGAYTSGGTVTRVNTSSSGSGLGGGWDWTP